jgi:putative membrane protein
MKLIVKVVVVALALLLAQQIVPGISVSGFGIALIVALVLGLINLIIRPILLLLTLPITIITFGLFALILNALLFWTTSALVLGFTVSGFVPAFLGSLIVSSAHFIVDRILP